MTPALSDSSIVNQSIIACGQRVDIGAPVVLWNEKGGFNCPNKRGRESCSQHDPALNDQPTQPEAAYQILDSAVAYRELKQAVHQLVLHYDVCFCSWQCHQIMKDSSFKGSQFYLDLDGTIYQTCDLYWKTNTGPSDDRIGNIRSVHVEMANLSWEALKEESDLYKVTEDQYLKTKGRWQLNLPETYRKKLRIQDYKVIPARVHKSRGYFSRRINGQMVRMWDFTEEQYQSIIQLSLGIHKLLPKIKLQVPSDEKTGRIPLDRIRNFSRFSGVLGHCHIQNGMSGDLRPKYDPGSAFNWPRLRKAFFKESRKKKG
ncbi:Translation elongation factor LepA [hydrothermal vent metagenome]|uniref:Translation elongation factor LepA n=1 Tax=hydrothermal vent metagenome TaxID=652676 RepID=A0A3B1BN32_9ZZZZ